jgi:S-adenosylmethionine decarboxylase
MVQNSSLVKTAHDNESLPRSHAESPLAFSRPGPEQEIGDTKDYMVEVDGTLYAGTHVLADLWQATGLDDIELIEQSLREAVDTCGATLLHIHLHEFTPNGGVSGVAVLAESHISVHTWPEHGFAAFDIFMCGDCDPRLSVPVLERYFQPEHVETNIQMRGRVG